MKRRLANWALPGVVAGGLLVGGASGSSSLGGMSVAQADEVSSTAGRDASGLAAGSQVRNAVWAHSDTRVRSGFARNTTVARGNDGGLLLGISYVVDKERQTVGGHFSQGTQGDGTFFNHVWAETHDGGDDRELRVGGGLSSGEGGPRSRFETRIRDRRGVSQVRAESGTESP